MTIHSGQKRTIPLAFFKREIPGDRRALLTRDTQSDGRDSLGSLFYSDLERMVREFAMGLLSIGVKPGDRIALAMENGPEWIVSDLAITSVGAITVPVYTNLPEGEIAFILKDSASRAIILSRNLTDRVLSIRHHIPSLNHLIVSTDEDVPADKDILSLKGVATLGKESGTEGLLNERLETTTGSSPFSLIYTSGTTGKPKGTILTHNNILSNIESVLRVIEITGDDIYLSFLPLSHIFERMVHHLLLLRGACIAYSRGLASVGADMAFFKPTLMAGVPFFFERLRGRIYEALKKGGSIKRRIIEGIIEKGRNITDPSTIRHTFLERLFIRRIRKRLNPRLRLFISGGAPLPVETAGFFWSLGIPVLEGYGLTETSPVVAVNTPSAVRLGTVGRPIPGVEVRINMDGEILVKGPNVMEGYHNMPEMTGRVIKDGWFHTGDVGFVDEDGFLVITGRKKDIIVTSTGKNVSPQKIETLLKADEYIKEALVYGDRKPHLVALIIPDRESLVLSGIIDETQEDLSEMEGLYSFLEERIHRRLRGLARYEQIRRFAILNDTFSVETGELTPTMKIKRDMVAQRFQEIIERLYE